jgi:hypothetical protein
MECGELKLLSTADFVWSRSGQTENNFPANELLVLPAHTSGLHGACMHRRDSPSIPILAVGDFKKRIGDDLLIEKQISRSTKDFHFKGRK